MPRRVWAPRGQRPIATVHPRYAWLYLYGFVRPTSGAVEGFLGNAANTALIAAVLARFAAATGAGAGKTVVPVLDPAGRHVSERLAVPEGLRRVFLPPSRPELQPAPSACGRSPARRWPTRAPPPWRTSTASSPRAASNSPISPTSSGPTPTSPGGPKPPD